MMDIIFGNINLSQYVFNYIIAFSIGNVLKLSFGNSVSIQMKRVMASMHYETLDKKS